MKQLALMLLFSKRYQRAATFSNPFNFECAKIQLFCNFFEKQATHNVSVKFISLFHLKNLGI
jgi:hypothetical protein